MQHEIRAAQDLLGSDGRISEEGWARNPYWRYERSSIRAGWHRIKEWDYYSVLSHGGRFGITITMSDLGYAGLFALCFLDFQTGQFAQVDSLKAFPMGRTGFSPDSDTGKVSFTDSRLRLEFEYLQGRRILRFSAPDLTDSKGNIGLDGLVELAQPGDLESMNIATSWAENRRAFYYNRKINCMPASGGFSLGGKSYVLSLARTSAPWTGGVAGGLTATAGIGVPPPVISMACLSDGTSATVSRIEARHPRMRCSTRGKLHKLTDVFFHIDKSDYMKPWRFSSADGRFRDGLHALGGSLRRYRYEGNPFGTASDVRRIFRYGSARRRH